MKKYFLFITLILCAYSGSIAQVLELNKIIDFAIGGRYDGIDNLKIEFPYLYITSGYGFEIYEMYENGNIELLSRVPLYGWSSYLGVKDNYAYVNSIGSDYIGSDYDPFNNRLCQIDITDRENPEIINEIISDCETSNGGISFYGNSLAYPYYNSNSNPFLKIYSIPDMELINDIPTEQLFYPIQPLFIKINDSLSIKRIPYTNNHFNVYDFSDPTNVIELGEINLSECNLDLIGNFKMISENIIASISFDGIAFWNISNILDWEFISSISTIHYYTTNFTQVENDYLIVIEQGGLESINISDINNPYSVDYLDIEVSYTSSADIECYNNNVYFGALYEIVHFAVTDGIISKQSDICQYPHWESESYIYQGYLFLTTMHKGIWIFDISNIGTPEHIHTMLPEHYILYTGFQDSLLALWDGGEYNENFQIKIFDISEPDEPVLRNTIAITSYSTLKFGGSDLNHIYLFDYYPYYPENKLRKYDISNEGEGILEFEFSLPFDLCHGFGGIYDGHAYLLGPYQAQQNLCIIGGLEDNDPEIIDTIANFEDEYYYPRLYKCDEYFYISYSDQTSPGDKYFELQSPTELVHLFTLNANSNYGKTTFTNDLLFVPLDHSNVYIYDVSDNPTGQLDTIFTFYDYGFSSKCLFYEENDTKYLFHCQDEAVSVYEYSFTGVDDHPQSVNSIQLSNYPNPFSTSTTISFFNTKPSKNTKIKIYNVKGQLVKTLLPFTNHHSSTLPRQEDGGQALTKVVWDGKDENGRKVPSGIYLCKLSIGKDKIVRKMVLLR